MAGLLVTLDGLRGDRASSGQGDIHLRTRLTPCRNREGQRDRGGDRTRDESTLHMYRMAGRSAASALFGRERVASCGEVLVRKGGPCSCAADPPRLLRAPEPPATLLA